MKLFRSLTLVVAAAIAVLSLCAFPGCAETLHKPTTVGNAGTTALVAYAAGGYTAGKYFALPLCAPTPVYPCKTQAINDKLLLADTAAYKAAKAADAASATAAEKEQAAKDIAALKDLNASSEVRKQVDLAAGDKP